MIYLHKALPLLLSPLFIGLFLLLANVYFKKAWITVGTVLVLYTLSLPYTAFLIWRGLEADAPYRTLESVQPNQAVIVLSGMLYGFEKDGKVIFEWTDPDRFNAGIRLIHQNKASYLIFTRGQLPWKNDLPPEGEVLREFAIERGVKPEQILLTSKANNTEQEANAIRAVMEEHQIDSAILVTASFHMPRAQRLMASQGITIDPYPVDFKGQRYRMKWLDLLPEAHAFRMSSVGIREFLGRAYYSLKLGLS